MSEALIMAMQHKRIKGLLAESAALRTEIERLRVGWDALRDVHEADKLTLVDRTIRVASLTAMLWQIRSAAQRLVVPEIFILAHAAITEDDLAPRP